jgi:hypothetical protein
MPGPIKWYFDDGREIGEVEWARQLLMGSTSPGDELTLFEGWRRLTKHAMMSGGKA